jgi:hypothetical protein
MLFNDSMEIDIYPLTLSDKSTKDLQKEDKEFYKYISNFLKIKGLLYHLDYNLGSESFDGYIKDIDEEYTFKDATNTKLTMSGMVFNGKGSLFHPSKINSTLDKMVVKSVGKTESLDLVIEDIQTSSTFKTKTTYTSEASVKNMEFKTQGLEKAEMNIKGIAFNVGADTQSEKAKFTATSSFEELSFKTVTSNISLYNFNYDVAIKDVDKDGFEEFAALLSKAQTNLTPELQEKVSKSMFHILSKGLIIDLKDISVKKVAKDSQKAVDAFSFNALLNVKPDANMLKNINTNPAEVIKNIKLDALMKISKDFFVMMNKEIPMSMLAGGFAKELGNDYVFDIKFKDSKLSVNGKEIK